MEGRVEFIEGHAIASRASAASKDIREVLRDDVCGTYGCIIVGGIPTSSYEVM